APREGLPPSWEPLGVAIRAAGLRRTAPRAAVLRHMAGASAPLSHGELVDALGDEFDRVTVYRNLLDLVTAGLVTRTDLGDHVWRFELRRPDADHAAAHPHFVCVGCGAVSCLPAEAVRVVPGRGAPRALRSRRVEVQVK